MNYDTINCDRCGKESNGEYLLSHKTKGLKVHCTNCGKHYMPYKEGLNLPIHESKSYKEQVLNLFTSPTDRSHRRSPQGLKL